MCVNMRCEGVGLVMNASVQVCPQVSTRVQVHGSERELECVRAYECGHKCVGTHSVLVWYDQSYEREEQLSEPRCGQERGCAGVCEDGGEWP